MTPEMWKPIPGYSGYDVSNFGRVRTYRRNPGYGGGSQITDVPQKFLKWTVKDNGYAQVCLFINGKRHYRGVHCLMALAFYGPPSKAKPIACHNDGHRLNNVIGNIRYDSQSGNLSDRVKHGTFTQQGETSGQAKLTESDVLDIKKLYASDVTPTKLGIKFGVDRSTIHGIVSGRTWKHLHD